MIQGIRAQMLCLYPIGKVPMGQLVSANSDYVMLGRGTHSAINAHYK